MIDIGGPGAAARGREELRRRRPRLRAVALRGDARRAPAAGERRRSDPRRELAAEAFAHTAAYEASIAALVRRRRDLPAPPPPLARARERARRTARTRTSAPPTTSRPASAGTSSRASSSSRRQGALLQQPQRPRRGARGPARVRAPHLRDRQAREPVRRRRSPPTVEEAYEKALASDPVSAYGGVVALNREVDPPELAARLAEQFVEVLIAPEYDGGRRSRPSRGKEALRILADRERRGAIARRPRLPPRARRVPRPGRRRRGRRPRGHEGRHRRASRRSGAGATCSSRGGWCKHVASNAIVIAQGPADDRHRRRPDEPRGRGPPRARQGRRVRARPDGGARSPRTPSSRSRTGPQLALDAGVGAIVQPGGSKRDEEVIAAVEGAEAVMVFTAAAPLPPLRWRRALDPEPLGSAGPPAGCSSPLTASPSSR